MRPYATVFGSFTGFFVAGLLAACGPVPSGSGGSSTPPPLPAKPGATATTNNSAEPQAKTRTGAETTITLLYTSDEHGWLEALSKDGISRGGAAELCGRFVTVEGHCPGPVPAGVDPAGALSPASPEDCARPRTLLLSGGDNFTGPAISTYLAGEPMAAAMSRLGYASSAFGNHEFDFGREKFPTNRDRAKLTYLAANVKIDDGRLAGELGIRPFQIFERRGVKIGVVGLAARDTLKAALAERFTGITFEPAEPSLDRAVRAVRDGGADVVVVTAHECPGVLVPIVKKHPEWRLAFVGGGHCHKRAEERAGDVPVMTPEWRLHQYVRVVIKVNPSLPPEARLVSVEPSIVDVTNGENIPADPPLARMVAASKEKVDQALGATIGFTTEGIGSEEVVGKMVSDAWLAELGGDVAVVNRGGIRQTIPKGPISIATLWGVLPFDNWIVKVSMPGDALAKELDRHKFIVSGAKKGADGKWTVGGKAIDPKRKYAVLITDFMQGGGDGAEFGVVDPKGVATGIQWRDPVIAWIKKQKTTSAAPLEKKLPPPPTIKIPPIH